MLIEEYHSGLGSSVVQPETASLTYGPRQRQLLSGTCSGLLFDTVGDPASLPDVVTRLINAGYGVHLLVARVDVAVAEARVMHRAVETGRVVSLAYLRRKHGVPEKALEAVIKAALPLAGWGLWDTSASPLQLQGGGVFAHRPTA